MQGALKLIMEPVFEADFQPGSYGYRPRRTAHEALVRVAEAIALGKTHVIDLDLRSYFDGIRHHLVLEKVAKRIDDDDVMHLLKLLLKVNGKRGVGQGSVLAPLLSNLYLNEVDRMLERAKEYTRFGQYTGIEYARFADDLVVLIHAHPSKRWLLKAVDTRLRQELAKLQVQINEEKSRKVDLVRGESFGFLGFDFRRVRSLNGRWRPQYTPKLKKRTALLRQLREIFWRYRSQPVQSVVTLIHPILRGWVNYFAIGHSSRCFNLVKRWVERGAEDSAPSPARPESSRVWMVGVEYGATVRGVWPVQRLSRASGPALGTSWPSGLITLAVNHTRERSAVTPHAAFDVAGAGNVVGLTLRRRASPRPYRGHFVLGRDVASASSSIFTRAAWS